MAPEGDRNHRIGCSRCPVPTPVAHEEPHDEGIDRRGTRTVALRLRVCGAGAGPVAVAVDGHLTIRDRGERERACVAGRCLDPRTWRQRDRCGGRDQRDDGPRRADERRRGRRPLRDRVRSEDRETLRTQLVRLGARGADAGVPAIEGDLRDAAERHPLGDGPGNGGRLGQAPHEIRQDEIRRRPRARHRARRGGLRSRGSGWRVLERQRKDAEGRRRNREDLPDRRPRSRSRRDLQESRSCVDLQADRGRGTRRVLQGRDHQEDCG